MRKFYKLSAIALVLAMLLSFSQTVTFADDLEAKAEETIASIGIIRERCSLEQKVTFAEYITLAVRILGLEDVAISAVSEEGAHWASGYVSVAESLSLLDGVSDFEFNDVINYKTALTVSVNVLGYGFRAKSTDEYLRVATQLGIDTGITLPKDGELDRGKAYILLENMLDVEIASRISFGENEVYGAADGNTLRNNLNVIHRRVLKEGIVEANSIASLNYIEGEETGIVTINGEKYEVGATNAESLLGQHVEFYAEYPKDKSMGIITWIKPHKSNKTVNVLSEDIIEHKNGRVLFYDKENDNRKKSIRITDSTPYIYNYKPITSYQGNKFDFSDGKFMFVDHNNDGTADVVFSWKIESFIVDKVFTDVKVISFKNSSFRGRSSIQLYFDDKDKVHIVKDTDGNTVGLDEIAEGSAVSVMASLDMSYIEVIASEEFVTGTIDSIDYENMEISIDGVLYNYTGSAGALRVRLNADFYLDAWGRVFFYEKTTSEYAYLVKKGMNSPSIKEKVELKFFTADKEFVILETAKKVKINDLPYKSADTIFNNIIEDSIVEYKTNSKGEVTSINYPEIYAERGERYFREDAFGFNDPDDKLTPIEMDKEKTMIFYIPVNGKDEDFYCSFEFEEDERYEVCAYEYDENEKSAKVVQVYMDTDMPFKKGYSASKIMMVSKIRVDCTQDYDTYRIYGIDKGEELELCAGENQEVLNILSNVSCGDVVQYVTNWHGEIVKARILLDASKLDQPFISGKGTAEEKIYADVLEIDKDSLTNYFKYRTHDLTVTTDYTARIIKRVPASVTKTDDTSGFNRYYVYDKYNKSVRNGRIEDILTIDEASDENSRIYIASNYGNVQFIVIFREVE